MFRFLHPWYLLGLILPLALLISELAFSPKPFLKFSFFKPSRSLFRRRSWFGIYFGSFLVYLAMTCFVVALARPQFGRKETEVTSEGIDIVLALDASESMAAMDFKLDGEAVDRLTVVKKVVTDFLKQQQADRIGMVIFGELAYTQCPLTLDYDVLVRFMDEVKIGIAGNGTAIGDGLALSVKRLKDLPGKSKVVILLTDGRNNSGKISPEKAAEIAKTFGIRVYTIGIGTKGPVPFPQPGVFGNRLVYVNLDMDEEPLKAIANETGGRFFFATDTQKLESIYQEIGRLEKTEAKVKHFETFDELFQYFVYAGLGLILLEFMMASTVLRRLA